VEKSRLYIFDFIRAFAVLIVLLGHYLCAYHSYEQSSPVWIKFHPVGVGMFFFISGYLIFMTLTKSRAESFLIHRYFRLAPSLAAGLLVLGILQGVNSFRPYLLGIFFIGDFFQSPNVLGIDMWTLHTETRFYLLSFAVYFCLIGDRFKNVGILLVSYVISIAIIVSAITFLNQKYPGLHFSDPKWNIFCIMYLYFGIFLYLYHEMIIPISALAMISLLHMFLISALRHLFFLMPLSTTFKDNYLVGCLLCLGLIAFRKHMPHSRLVSSIASISYPVYIIHHYLVSKWGVFSILPIFVVSSFISIFIEHPVMAWAKKRI